MLEFLKMPCNGGNGVSYNPGRCSSRKLVLKIYIKIQKVMHSSVRLEEGVHSEAEHRSIAARRAETRLFSSCFSVVGRFGAQDISQVHDDPHRP